MPFDASNPLILLALAAGGIFAVLTAVAYPKLWFFLLIASYPMVMATNVVSLEASEIMASPAKFAGFIALAATTFDALRRRKRPVMNWWLTILTAIMTGAYILSAALNYSPMSHWLLRMVSTIIFFVLADYWGQTPKDLENIKRSMVWAVFVASSFSLVWNEVINPVDNSSPFYPRYGGSFVNPNGAAEYLLVSFAMSLGLFLDYFNKGLTRKWVTYALLSLGLVGFLYSTGSRGGFLGFAVFLLSVVGLAWRDLRGRFALPLLAVGGAVLLASMAPQVFQERIRQDLLKDSRKAKSIDTLDQRLQQIEVSIEVFKNSPLVGAGPGNVRAAMGRRLAMSFSVHNRYFEALAASGLSGTVPYVLLTLLCLVWLYKANRRPAPGLGVISAVDFSMMLGLVVSSMSQTTVFEKSVSLVMAVAGVHHSIQRNAQSSQIPNSSQTSSAPQTSSASR